MRGNPWFRIAVTAGTVVLVLLLTASWRFLASHGVFTSVKLLSPGLCRTIEGVPGAGDIAVDSTDRIAFIAVAAHAPSKRDGLYAYAYGSPGARLVKLSGAPSDFHPVAISLRRDAGGATLMAINHRGDGGFSVAVFTLEITAGTAKLAEIGSVTGDVLIDPADIAALDANRFYVVNRHTSHTKLGRWLDDVFALPRSNVLYFDGVKFVPVAEQLIAASGLDLSRDGRFVFVSENSGRTLLSFGRNPFTGQLDNAGSLAIPSGLEKVNVSDDGDVWIAGQPKTFAVNTFRGDPARPAPSQVFRVTVRGGVPQSVSLVYANRGDEIGAASAAALAGGHLFIGSTLDDKLLDCR